MSGRTLDAGEIEAVAAARFNAIVQAPYLASVLTAMTFVRSPGIGTLAVDSRVRVYVDPSVLHRWTSIELAGVLLHEAHHVVRGHHQRQIHSGIAPSVFNIASDLEINDDLLRAGVEMPDGALQARMFELPEHELAEWYASRLPNHLNHDQGCGSGAGGVVGDFELDVDAAIPGLDADKVELIRDAVARHVKEHGAGASGGLERWATARLRSSAPWPVVLRAAVRRFLPRGPGHCRHTWSKPRRHNPTRAMLPSLRNVPMHVGVVIDSSGSMSRDHLDQAASDVAALRAIPEVGQLTVVSCDVEVNEVSIPRKGSPVALIGGGGTSLEPALLHIAELRPPVDLIVVITDGYTNWPDVAPSRRLPIFSVMPEGSPPGPEWMTTLTRRI